MKTKILTLLPVAFLATAAQGITLTINNLEVRTGPTQNNAFGSGDASTANLSAVAPALGGTTASSEVTWSGLSLDGVGAGDDVVTFTLVVTSNTTAGVTWGVDGLGWGAETQIDGTDSLTFTVANVAVSGGSAAGAFSAAFDGFTQAHVIEFAGKDSDTVGSTVDVAGETFTATLPNVPGFQTQDFFTTEFATPIAGVTYDNAVIAATQTGFAGFRARGQDLQFTFDPVPEPSSALLCGLGVLGLLKRRR